ncbi:MAG: hypothetical protein VCD00_12455 [Candidatus Hydrogenedentota bacterium]
MFHTEGFVHAGSGIPFPATLVGFGQYVVVDEGDGVRVEYLLLRGGERVSVSVRVYPNPDVDPDEPKKRESTLQASASQSKRLDAIMQEIEESGTDEEHRFVALYDVPIMRGELPYFGKKAFFRTKNERFANTYLFEYGVWFVEYRTEFTRDLERHAEKFLTDHTWFDGDVSPGDQDGESL